MFCLVLSLFLHVLILCVHLTWCAGGGQRVTCENQFSPSAKSILGIQLLTSVLVASPSTRGGYFLSPATAFLCDRSRHYRCLNEFCFPLSYIILIGHVSCFCGQIPSREGAAERRVCVGPPWWRRPGGGGTGSPNGREECGYEVAC